MDFDISEIRFPSPLTVSEINNFIKDLLDETPPFRDLYVKGEISNFKAHSSGHLYFSLKDESSSLKCVMFRGEAYRLDFKPENGMTVLARGRISSFVRDGAYQLYVSELQPDGLGSMYLAMEQLKAKLLQGGFLDESKKKTLPIFPKKIGVVTSPTGAAVQDILNILGRRYPLAEVCIYPALVQGEGAPLSVAAGIGYFNNRDDIDVLIVGRGGGSVEDLWAFNTETVAMAVVSSNVPVISAVGHETDFTICDLVADMRAPTPSAAAEICVPDCRELKAELSSSASALTLNIGKSISANRKIIDEISRSRSLRSPKNNIDDRRMALDSISDKIDSLFHKKLDKSKADFATLTAKLDALSPLNVLSRGYSASFREGKTVKSINDVSVGDSLKVMLFDGEIGARVETVKENENG